MRYCLKTVPYHIVRSKSGFSIGKSQNSGIFYHGESGKEEKGPVKPQNIPRIAGIRKSTPENGVEQLPVSGAANDFSFFSTVRPEWSGTGRVAIGRQLHIQRRLDMAVHIENVEAHAVQMAILAFLVDTEGFQGGHFVSAAFS